MNTCIHCGREVRYESGRWIDPEATGDDSIWRETCDQHDTFPAEHEAQTNDPQTQQRDPDTNRRHRKDTETMNDKLPSDSEALDHLATLLSQNEWNADLMEPVFRIVTQTGRTIDDNDDDEEQ